MPDVGSPLFAHRMNKAIKEGVMSELGDGAYEQRYVGSVASVDYTQLSASVYIQGNATASQGFKIRNPVLPIAGDMVSVCISGQERWIDSVIGSQSLSGRGFSTSDTSNTYVGQYTKMASGSIGGLYGNTAFTLLLGGNGSGSTGWAKGEVRVRVKQQAAFGNQPYITCEFQGTGMDAADFRLVVTSAAGPTTWELWVKVDESYSHIFFQPIFLDTGSYSVTFYEVNGFSASLPSGTVYSGVGPLLEASGLTVGSTTNAFVPSGVIVLWSGTNANVPVGWVLCNGTNGTPDLTDRFIIGGTGADNGSGGTTSATAALSHTGTAVGNHSALAGHQHETPFIDNGAQTLSTTQSAFGSGTSRTRDWTGSFSSASGSYAVALTQSVSGGTPSAHSVTDPSAHSIQKYYRLAYIMKV